MTINDVVEQVKETILRFGEHSPFLIVEGTRDGVVMDLYPLGYCWRNQKPIFLSAFFGKSHKGGLSCLCRRNRRQPRRDASEIESSRGKNVLQMDFGRTLVACLA